MDGTPQRAHEIVGARRVDYVAICATSREAAVRQGEAPNGLLAQLLGGASVPWLEPISAVQPTALRLWRVVRDD